MKSIELYLGHNDLGFEEGKNGSFLVSAGYNKYSSLFNFEVFKQAVNLISKKLSDADNILIFSKNILLFKEDKERINQLMLSLNKRFRPLIGAEPLYRRDLSGKRVVIIDTHNFFHRNFHAMQELRSSDGTVTTLLKAMLTYLKYLGEYDYIVFTSEGTGSIRKYISSDYKENRREHDSGLIEQIELCNKVLTDLGFNVLMQDGYEADDMIGAAVKHFSSMNANVEIHTTDKDMFQLISDNVKIYNPMKKVFIDSEACLEKFGVTPDKIVYLLALMGDASDNVSGVSGIGLKTAAKILNNDFIDYSSEISPIQSIYLNIDQFKGKIRENLERDKDKLITSYHLVKLYDYILKDFDFRQFEKFNWQEKWHELPTKYDILL